MSRPTVTLHQINQSVDVVSESLAELRRGDARAAAVVGPGLGAAEVYRRSYADATARGDLWAAIYAGGGSFALGSDLGGDTLDVWLPPDRDALRARIRAWAVALGANVIEPPPTS